VRRVVKSWSGGRPPFLRCSSGFSPESPVSPKSKGRGWGMCGNFALQGFCRLPILTLSTWADVLA
jgi:hypothetical protein